MTKLFGAQLPAGPIAPTACLVAVILFAVIWLRVSRLRKAGENYRQPLVRWLMAAWFAITTVILLTPRHAAPDDGTCSFVLTRVADFSYDFERILNVLMFLPAGVLCVLATRTLLSRLSLGVAILAMPVIFEALQGTDLIGRTCSATDVVDNWTGAVLGAALSGLAVVALKPRSGSD